MVQSYLKKHSLLKITKYSLHNDYLATGDFIEQIGKLVRLLQYTSEDYGEKTKPGCILFPSQ